MQILHTAYQHYTEQDGMTEHNLIRVRKNEKILIEHLIAAARACNAAFISSKRFRQHYKEQNHSATTEYLLEEELFCVHIKGGDEQKRAYTLPELWKALGEEYESS